MTDYTDAKVLWYKQAAKNMLFSWMTEDLDTVALNFGAVVGKSGYVFKITWTHCLKLRGKNYAKEPIKNTILIYTHIKCD